MSDLTCECSCGLRGCFSRLPHGIERYTRGCRCDICAPLGRSASVKRQTNANAETLPGARRHGQYWTAPEIEIALRDDLTTREVAHMLGRSYRGVKAIRQKMRSDSHRRRIVGIKDRP